LSDKPFLIGLVLVVFGVFGAIRNWTTHTQETAIARDGLRAEARVTRKWETDHSDSAGADYFIGYSFDLPSGQPIEAEHEIDVARYRALRKGDPIPVLYAPEDPRRSFPEGAGATSRSGAVFASTIGVLFALFGVGLLVRHWPGKGRRSP
jgi:hypothetical protein